MVPAELAVYDDPEKLAAGAAERIFQAAAESIAQRGGFTLCLTGGSTPRGAYTVLALQQGAAAVDWSRTFLFFGDERFVPHEDPRSNYMMAHESLLKNAPIAADHVFPMPTHLPTPQIAAQEYESSMKAFFGGDVEWPVFDMVLLGMGDDGHTASLFPGGAALQVKDRWVTSSPPGLLPPPVDRVTLTFPVFNAARQVMFLVSGGNKAAAFQDVYQGRVPLEVRPAAGIRPVHGRLTWLVDRAANGS